jgi:hypothetical protein
MSLPCRALVSKRRRACRAVAGRRGVTSFQKWVFPAIAATSLVSAAVSSFAAPLGQSDNPPSAFNGVWKREDGDDTITIIVEGGNAYINTSAGAHGIATFKGDTIEYTGQAKTDDGLLKTAGIYEVSPDGNKLAKHRQIYSADGTQEETVTYTRVRSSAPSTSTSSSSASPTPVPTATPAPAASLPFVGVWHPADDSPKLTVTVNGRSAILKYTDGSRDSGTIRGNKLECATHSKTDGLKSTDQFEMSSNGRTLIRRRTLQSPTGETGHETLTFNRSD